MVRAATIAGASAVLLALVSGCAEQKTETAARSGPGLEHLVAAGLPEQTVGVLAAKAATKTGDRVVLAGRVKDFVNGAAVLTVADFSLKDCKAMAMKCATPWDYCCEPKESITSASATVKMANAGGEPYMQGLKGVGGLDHLVDIAAEGKVERDDAGNLTVLAEKLYVKR
jgi:hypothetical protein